MRQKKITSTLLIVWPHLFCGVIFLTRRCASITERFSLRWCADFRKILRPEPDIGRSSRYITGGRISKAIYAATFDQKIARRRGGVAFSALLLWSGLRRRLSGKLAVHGVGREVEAVRPAYRAELVRCDLAEYRFVPQRLENLTGKLAGEVYCACNPVVELDVQPVL
jgi:hypothetical protein